MMKTLAAVLVLLLLSVSAQAQQGIDQMNPGTALTGTEKFPMCQGCSTGAVNATTTTANAIKTFVNTGAAGVGAINAYTGQFFLGGGENVNQQWVTSESNQPLPWNPWTPGNVINQGTGRQFLRNSSMIAVDHWRFMTKDAPATNPYNINISTASATLDSVGNGSGVAGNRLGVSSSPTGTGIHLFSRVTDDANIQIPTTGATAIPTLAGATCVTAATTCQLQFAPGFNGFTINAGMYVTDLDAPRAIAGNITVQSATSGSGQVVLTSPVGFGDNTSGNTSGGKLVGPGVSIGDHIAFSTIKRGTNIIGLGTCTDPWSGSCYYVLNNATQLISSAETVTIAGGWGIEGNYWIPVGTAGGSNYLTCNTISPSAASLGMFNPGGYTCTVHGSLNDLILRIPIDSEDAARFNCSLYAGTFLECVTTNAFIQPVTFQLSITYGNTSTPSLPFIRTYTPCPLNPNNPAGTNSCNDNWTNATADLITPNLWQCYDTNSPVQCTYAFSFVPTGVQGGYDIEFHFGAMTNGNSFTIEGFELKQTPGVTCPGQTLTATTTPCFNRYPGMIDVENPNVDRNWNKRFTQTIAGGWETGINGASGYIESASGSAWDATHFWAAWALPVPMRCDMQHLGGPKGGFGCPPPNFYYTNPGNYQIYINGSQNTGVTALALQFIGRDSVTVAATTGTTMTANQGGTAVCGGSGSGNACSFMLDASIIGP